MFILHDAIKKNKSIDEINALLQYSPELIYNLDEDGSTVFDVVRRTDDIETRLCLFKQAIRIFSQKAPAKDSKWAAKEMLLEIRLCISSARAILFPPSGFPVIDQSVGEKQIEQWCLELLVVCKELTRLYFNYIEIVGFPYDCLDRTLIEIDEEKSSLLIEILYIFENFLIVFSEFKIEEKNANDKLTMELAKIGFKIMYAKLVQDAPDVNKNAVQVLDRLLGHLFYQNFFDNASDAILAKFVADLPKPLPTKKEDVLKESLQQKTQMESKTENKMTAFALELQRVLIHINAHIISWLNNPIITIDDQALARSDLAFLTLIIKLQHMVPEDHFILGSWNGLAQCRDCYDKVAEHLKKIEIKLSLPNPRSNYAALFRQIGGSLFAATEKRPQKDSPGIHESSSRPSKLSKPS